MKSTVYIVSLALALTGCVYKTGALRKQVSRYQGDGSIADASIGAPPIFWGPGFRINFPGFDPHYPFEHSYSFKGVPKTKYGNSMIYVRFPGASWLSLDEAKRNVTSVLTYTISDEANTVLNSREFIFSRSIWSWQGGGGEGVFGLWIERAGQYGAENKFYFDPAKRYTLRIDYKPGSVPPSTTNMFISIENGGKM